MKRALILTLASICLRAGATSVATAEPSLYGLWLSDCSTDPSNGFPSQDALEFKADSFIQYSLIFHDGDDCSAPPIVTKITYGLRVKDRPKSKELTLKPAKIELGAIDVKGAVFLSEQKECDQSSWRIQKLVDCSKSEPYRSVIRSESFTLLIRLDKGRLAYKDITPSKNSDDTTADDEYFSRVSGLPPFLTEWK